MQIKQKEKDENLQMGIASIVIAFLLFSALVSVDFPAGNLAGGFGKLFSLFLFIVGLVKIQKYHEYKQEKEILFDIKAKKAFCDDEGYALIEAYLTIDFKQDGDFYRVTLWHETDKKTLQIFEDVVFDSLEMQTFLELIKPYRKTEICLLENEELTKEINKSTDEQCNEVNEYQKVQMSELIGLFKRGLIVQNREIFYNEIASFSTEITKIYEKRYLDIKIVLNNKSEITLRVNKENEQAKALYANLFFRVQGKISEKDYICPKYNFWSAFVILFLIAVGFSGEFGWIVIIMTVFIALFYFASLIDFFYHKEICNKVHKIIQKRAVYDRM